MFFVQKCSTKNEYEAVKILINEQNLRYEDNVTDVFAIFYDNKAVATASIDYNIIKMVAVDPNYQGENLTAKLFTTIKTHLFTNKIDKYFLYTKPSQVKYFIEFGFSLIAKTEDVALLENKDNNIIDTISKIKKEYQISDNKKAAIVMNCNPMTNGHLYLIELVAKNEKEVLIILLEEDRSFVPYSDRLKIVKESTKHLKNVKVIPSTKYIISQATFPTYFLKENSNQSLIYMSLDVLIFKSYFMPELLIEKRYVGNEPYDLMTNSYNEVLKKELNNNLEIVERFKYDNKVVSASYVRHLAELKQFEEVKKLVPVSSYNYLLKRFGDL